MACVMITVRNLVYHAKSPSSVKGSLRLGFRVADKSHRASDATWRVAHLAVVDSGNAHVHLPLVAIRKG